MTTPQDHHAIVRDWLLQITTTIPPEELFPTLADGAAAFVVEDPFRVALCIIVV